MGGNASADAPGTHYPLRRKPYFAGASPYQYLASTDSEEPNKAEEGIVIQSDDEAAIAAFIEKRGITRCPTACLLPTQGTVSAADRAVLQKRAASLEERRLGFAQLRWQLLSAARPAEGRNLAPRG